MYSGTRFFQLKEWQNKATPIQLHGGIQGRQMNSISNTLKVQIDVSYATDDPIVGIKLGKNVF